MHRLACVGFVLFALLAVAFAGTCSSDAYAKFSRDRLEYTVYGGRLEGRVLYDDKPLPNNTIIWSIDRFVEREKTPQLLGGDLIDYLCIGPGIPAPSFLDFMATGRAYVNPNEPPTNESCPGWAIPGFTLPCGTVVNSFLADEWDCDIVLTNTTVAGHTVETIFVNMTHVSAPNRNLITSFMLPYENFTYRHTFANNQYEDLTFVRDQLKVNYEMPNSFPFLNNDPILYYKDMFGTYASNATWVTLWWNLTVESDRVYDVNLAVNGTTFIFQAGPPDEFMVTASIAINAFVDGKTTNPNTWQQLAVSFKMDDTMDYKLKVNFGVPFCAGNTSHFDTMWYDPTFGALFGPDPTAPVSPVEKKIQNTTRIIVAVVVSIVVVLIIIAIAVPAVMLYFRPYLARRKAGYANGHLGNSGTPSSPDSGKTSADGNGWTRSAKPSS